jgi:hypothetical protein
MHSIICGALPLYASRIESRLRYQVQFFPRFVALRPSAQGQIAIFLMLLMMNGPTFSSSALSDVAIV